MRTNHKIIKILRLASLFGAFGEKRNDPKHITNNISFYDFWQHIFGHRFCFSTKNFQVNVFNGEQFDLSRTEMIGERNRSKKTTFAGNTAHRLQRSTMNSGVIKRLNDIIKEF